MENGLDGQLEVDVVRARGVDAGSCGAVEEGVRGRGLGGRFSVEAGGRPEQRAPRQQPRRPVGRLDEERAARRAGQVGGVDGVRTEAE